MKVAHTRIIQTVVTFEFAESAPETVRGTVVAGKPETAVFRAVKAAKGQCPNRRWSSVVVVLLGRSLESNSSDKRTASLDSESSEKRRYFTKHGTAAPGQEAR